MTLLHIVSDTDWQSAALAPTYTPPSLTTEGFIHLSTPHQVLESANRFYRGRTDLLLLVIDSERLTATVQFDEVLGHGTFPHLYGPLNTDAVISVVPFPLQEDGTFALPEVLSHA